MSTKTIAVESGVYRKLAAWKREGESFTRVIDRLVESQNGAGTCADAVRQAAAIWKGERSAAEADIMETVVKTNREQTDWSVEKPE